MKPPRGAILFAGHGQWSIGVWSRGAAHWTQTGISSTAGAAEFAERLPEFLKSAGLTGRPVVLALSSESCLSASIPTAALPQRDRRRAMEYRLEGKLPLAIEEVAADFYVHNGRALGVCVRAETIAAFVAAISRSGVRIAAACPAAILGLQSLPPADKSPDLLVWQTQDLAEVFLLEKGELLEWHSVPASVPDIALIVATCARTHAGPLRIALRGASEELQQQMKRLANVEIIAADAIAMNDAALDTARRMIAGDIAPLVDFQHEKRGAATLRRAIIAAVIGGMLLCASLTGALLWRANSYANRAALFEQQEQAVYHQLFPNEAMPVGIESRLRSFAGNLQDATSAGPSALALLYDILARLPANGHFQFDDLQFDSGQATLHGKVTSLAEADAIAAALRKDESLSVDDPQTQTLADGGVGFTLTAQLRRKP